MTHRVDVIVLGGGLVGISAAIHLQKRGRKVAVIDRQPLGLGASFGNAGLIQTEAIMPYMFPRKIGDLARYAQNRSTDSYYDPSALPRLLAPFFRYWRNSTPKRAMDIALARRPLVENAAADHLELAGPAGVDHLLKATGWLEVYRSDDKLAQARAAAGAVKAQFGVDFEFLNGPELAKREPALREGQAGAVYWPKPMAVTDPHALTLGYGRLFQELGGVIGRGDARTLTRTAGGWRVETGDGELHAREVVVSLGAWTPEIARLVGYRPPFFVKRGYHRHYAVAEGAGPTRPVLDAESGFLLAPMRAGLRLTTGAEFALRDAPSTPVQLKRVEPLARALAPAIGTPVEAQPWLGCRPCLPDMLPVIGPSIERSGVWFNFGHAHHGLTMAPTSGRLLAQMMTGERPLTDPTPYRAERFEPARDRRTASGLNSQE